MTGKDREEQRHKFKGWVVFIRLKEKKEGISGENNTEKY